jgi:hypothetical protein
MPYSFQLTTDGGVGGTRFLLGMPDPILFMNTDRPEDESWTLFRQSKRIDCKIYYPVTNLLNVSKDATDEIKKKNLTVLETILDDIGTAKQKGYKSIAIDTKTVIWKLLLPLVNFGKTDKIPPEQRGILTSQLTMIINELWRSGLNFGYTVRTKEEYKKNVPTGNMVPDSAKDSNTFAQTNIILSRRVLPNTGMNQWPFDGAMHFCAEITKCNPSPFLVGQWLYDGQISFDFIVNTIQQPYKVA